MTNIESEISIENRGDKTLEEFDWEDKEGVIHKGVVRYAQRNKRDFDGVVAVDRDRSDYRLKEHKIAPKTEEQIENVRKKLERSLDEPDKLAFIVLTIDGEVVGYSEFGPSEKEPNKTIINTTSVLQMEPKYKRINEKGEDRGFGFGRKLRTQVIKEAQDIFHARQIESNVHNWNKPSIALWENMGSERISETKEIDEKTGKPIMVFDPTENKYIESTKITFRHLDLDKKDE